VTVLERHADAQALGGPINLAPPATRILIQYGMENAIQEALKPQRQPVYFRRFDNGKMLFTIPVGTPEKLYGAP
jgi:hypothetical protein